MCRKRKYSTYRCKIENGYTAHICWVCSRFLLFQLSKTGLYTRYIEIVKKFNLPNYKIFGNKIEIFL